MFFLFFKSDQFCTSKVSVFYIDKFEHSSGTIEKFIYDPAGWEA
jgi:hypothetical protein